MSLFNLPQEASKLAKDFLNENPALMKKYISLSLSAIGAVLVPLDAAMKHLLAVQNLDPNTIPGLKAQQQFQAAMDATFEKHHAKDFDDDYNFSWLHKKWEETNRALHGTKLSKEKFMELTDVSSLTNRTAGPFTIDDTNAVVNQVAPESKKEETPLFPTVRERENITEIGGDAIDALRNALKDIEKNIKPTRPLKKGMKTTKKSANKTTGRSHKVKRSADSESRGSFKEPATRLAPDTDVVDVKGGVTKSSKPLPGRNLGDIASKKKSETKAKKEATPEFQKEMKAKLARVTALTNKMIENGLCSPTDAARQEQIQSLLPINDESLFSLERVIDKYKPTKDAIAENKFKGSFRRAIQKRG